ncbi:uncharacterized protein TRUGW13939_05704 [Talaromyces rugulosus]|uniref:aminodeoxychorismate synthase n=1 Tax=Talaromyces rugulosus TaxID=121627 RepID=A0A7H8QWY6_TALRU|nr:uncharacterized protein TRUGW13939_05704 [Talaromyces rugulosus]QKX58579.1 hypothetical protein TRUGW13939_05704 [Talaromyces rugulosus]
MKVTPRVLFIDAYDSFTNNIVGLLENKLYVDVTVVRMDDPFVVKHFHALLKAFDAVVVGPGPGHPALPKDIGIIQQLWELSPEDMLPVFGICLGFQSLGYAFGAKVQRLPFPRHGIVTRVTHCKSDIFETISEFEATQYHSLHVDIGKQDHDDLWTITTACPELKPLAWDLDDKHTERILMGHRHVSKPFWGVQFHPESICTTTEGARVLSTWWEHAQQWSFQNQRRAMTCDPVFQQLLNMQSTRVFKDSSSKVVLNGNQKSQLRWLQQRQKSVRVTDLVEALHASQSEVILLDSQGHNAGRYSILGIVDTDRTRKITYNVQKHELVCYFGNLGSLRVSVDSQQQVWSILQDSMTDFAELASPYGLPQSSPFWGGWMGYVSYEGGLESIGVTTPCSGEEPDFNFAFIDRSIVIDHEEGLVYIQSLIADDMSWLSRTNGLVSSLEDKPALSRTISSQKKESLNDCIKRGHNSKPVEATYRQKVLACQASLRAGDSYELCLTDETRILLPVETNPWELYKSLRINNPAPFGTFMRLSGATIVGSSPERFLRWNRDGQCQLRPIKGTVRKTQDMTFDKASTILNSAKERAENLMIVDLIRHDLSGVCGARSCSVPQLMQVEEYQTVYQLVSVIEGWLPKYGASSTTPTGIDVLKASLPPGSMTGAPKKRSCEILADLEHRHRGVYSGILGYMDVGGGGDFSVVIRTAFRWDDEVVYRPSNDSATPATFHVYRVGAGGAVTIQSTDKGEFDEMETKLDSVLETFVGPKVDNQGAISVNGVSSSKEQS